jgi:hypothetical protein
VRERKRRRSNAVNEETAPPAWGERERKRTTSTLAGTMPPRMQSQRVDVQSPNNCTHKKKKKNVGKTQQKKKQEHSTYFAETETCSEHRIYDFLFFFFVRLKVYSLCEDENKSST